MVQLCVASLQPAPRTPDLERHYIIFKKLDFNINFYNVYFRGSCGNSASLRHSVGFKLKIVALPYDSCVLVTSSQAKISVPSRVSPQNGMKSYLLLGLPGEGLSLKHLEEGGKGLDI